MRNRRHGFSRLLLLAPLLAMLLSLSPTAQAGGPRGPTPDEELGVLSHGELRAVQKPILKLEGTLEAGLTGLALPFDLYVTGAGGGGYVGWHFSEFLGLEALVAGCGGWETWPNQLLQNQGVRFDSLTPRLLAQVSLEVTPIYAKLSLLGRRIVHFDVGVLMGTGLLLAERTIYGDSVAAEGAAAYNPPLSLSLGVLERFYWHAFGQTLTLRLGLRDVMMVAESEAGQWVKHSGTLEVGIGVLLPLPARAGALQKSGPSSGAGGRP